MTSEIKCTTGFCSVCGSILPQLKMTGNIECYSCKNEFNPSVFDNMQTEYTIHFNTYSKSKMISNVKKEADDEGPILERKCRKCGNERMSYSTLQLRSADEGQTVFYTCTKCKFKESENS